MNNAELKTKLVSLEEPFRMWRQEDLRFLWRTLLAVLLLSITGVFSWNGYLLYETVQEEKLFEIESSRVSPSKISEADLAAIIKLMEGRAEEYGRTLRRAPIIVDPSL